MVLTPLAIVLTVLTVTTLIFQGLGLWVTQKFFGRSSAPQSENLPKVSILIPVRGVDEGALANWTSFCQQNYPDYEVLFGVMDPQDPAVPVLEQVVAQFPDRAQLLTNLPPRGINHQISNLSYLVEASHHEVVIFADSDIRVTPEYLQRVTQPLKDDRIGLVTCAYVDHRPQYLGAALAALGRSLDFIPSVLIARTLDGGLKFALGPTIVLKRSVLMAFGGLDPVLNRIGSDFHLGRLTREAGYGVELATYLLNNDCGEETPQQVFQRELRWSRTIRWNRGSEYYGLVFTHGTVYSLLLLLVSGLHPWAIGVWAVAWSLRIFQGFVLLSILQLPQLKRWLWILPLRDLMTFWVWLRGSYGREIFWRGRWLKVSGKGMLQEKS
ncbi:MAG: glycosyltransferase [Prochlorotrichaceae cyanobacterium]